MHKEISFDLTQKEILNSNSLPNLFIVKGKMVAELRKKANLLGKTYHDEKYAEAIDAQLDRIAYEGAQALKKSRLKKRLNKDKSLSKEEIDAMLIEKFPPVELSELVIVPPLFHHFRIKVVVYPPTRRRVDPPNLAPTTKALIDGLTDASWWPDDNFKHLLETSFRYGGLSGKTGVWTIKMIVEEIEDVSEYVLESEVM